MKLQSTTAFSSVMYYYYYFFFILKGFLKQSGGGERRGKEIQCRDSNLNCREFRPIANVPFSNVIALQEVQICLLLCD